MKDRGYKPNENAYASLLHAYVNGNHIVWLRTLAKDIHMGVIHPSWVLLKILVLVNGKCNFLKEIEGSFSKLKIQGSPIDFLTYNTMIDIYGKHGFINQSLDIIENMKPNGWKPDLTTYNSLISMYGRESNCKKS
jgi:pentatricopeptide repeat protein